VYLSLHIPGSICVGVSLWFGCGGVESVCRLNHYWSVHVECGGWGFMTVWNRGLISPGLCSVMSKLTLALRTILYPIPPPRMQIHSGADYLIIHFNITLTHMPCL